MTQWLDDRSPVSRQVEVIPVKFEIDSSSSITLNVHTRGEESSLPPVSKA
jgi:hypothetical protein